MIADNLGLFGRLHGVVVVIDLVDGIGQDTDRPGIAGMAEAESAANIGAAIDDCWIVAHFHHGCKVSTVG